MATTRPTPASIDAYIAGFPPDIQAILQKIRKVVRKAAPGAQEVISYQIPAFRQHGVLVYFAAFKNHIGFYPPVRRDAALLKAIAPYAGEKGNLQFPLDQPMPFDLIERITKHRVLLDQAKAVAKTARKTPRAPATKAASKTTVKPAPGAS